MAALSKSKLLASLQCQKRLWLEVHHPEFQEYSKQAQAAFDVGKEVGAIARKVYDPEGRGSTLDLKQGGLGAVAARTKELLSRPYPIFEAGFIANGALTLADILLPEVKNGGTHWRMIEVKSATSVKDYHHNDIGVQSYVALSAGVPLSAVSIAHIDSTWVYPGDEDYRGLLVEPDLTDEALGRTGEVEDWIAEAHKFAGMDVEPEIKTGKQCSEPFECGFPNYCKGKEPQLKHPASWLPEFNPRR